MNYKKLINVFKSQNENNLIAFGLITGLAVGVAIGVLFAQKKGTEIRKMLSKSLKKKNNINSDMNPQDQHVEDLRENTRHHASKLQGPENKRKDPTLIKVASAGSNAWKNQGISSAL